MLNNQYRLFLRPDYPFLSKYLNSVSWLSPFKDRIRQKLTVKGSTREQTVEGTAVAMVAVADREQANTSPQYLFQDKK